MPRSPDSTSPGHDRLVRRTRDAEFTFTVDSRLLEELGERLVGKPSMALAELVKNAYDADAETVDITIDRSMPGRILVQDDGHGMTTDEFHTYWMRVGSQHKRDQKRSKTFLRPFTGSKGIGRIATQMLSSAVRIISVAEATPTRRLLARLEWATAIDTGDLVDVGVTVTEETLSRPLPHGTTISLDGLKDEWSEATVRDLAAEVWQLQSPFGRLVDDAERDVSDFVIRLSSVTEALATAFHDQMSGVLSLWTARVVGEVRDGRFAMSMQFRGEKPMTFPSPARDFPLTQAHFELRFFELAGRQPMGIRLKDARAYLTDFGGVHIYDTGFRLPFYGQKDNDWLLISYDVARRVTLSELLPPEIRQIRRMMLSLPQWNQVLGAVEINTAVEPGLEVTITRDRLVSTPAFTELRDLVRQAIHWYANEKARRRLEAAFGDSGTALKKRARDFQDVLDRARPHLPEDITDDLAAAYKQGMTASKHVTEQLEQRAAALGAFATAGIAALGYQHELSRQLLLLERVADTLPTAAHGHTSVRSSLLKFQRKLRDVLTRTREIGSLFGHLLDRENMEEVKSFPARATVESIVRQVSSIQPSITFDVSGIRPTLRLPPAAYAEWVCIFQNALFNSLNALVDVDKRVIAIRNERKAEHPRILVEDTGSGVDLENSEELFLPFRRATDISRERRELGFGGAGLGLPIMRMIAATRGIRIAFKAPSPGFATALAIEWNEEMT